MLPITIDGNIIYVVFYVAGKMLGGFVYNIFWIKVYNLEIMLETNAAPKLEI